MEDCSTDERLRQETLCHRQWTDEYVEHPEMLMRQNVERSHLPTHSSYIHRMQLVRPSKCSLSTKMSQQSVKVKTVYSYGVSLVIWDHTVLPATRHKWTQTHLALTPARQAGTRFTYSGGMEGW